MKIIKHKEALNLKEAQTSGRIIKFIRLDPRKEGGKIKLQIVELVLSSHPKRELTVSSKWLSNSLCGQKLFSFLFLFLIFFKG